MSETNHAGRAFFRRPDERIGVKKNPIERFFDRHAFLNQAELDRLGPGLLHGEAEFVIAPDEGGAIADRADRIPRLDPGFFGRRSFGHPDHDRKRPGPFIRGQPESYNRSIRGEEAFAISPALR